MKLKLELQTSGKKVDCSKRRNTQITQTGAMDSKYTASGEEVRMLMSLLVNTHTNTQPYSAGGRLTH